MFPVPDGDTGTNLALTLRAVVEAVDGLDEPSISVVASRIAEAGVLGARGNSGMMLSHFFLGFADGLEGRGRAGFAELAQALGEASRSLYSSVEVPVEGTILTVVREATEAVERVESPARDLETLARTLLEAAHLSLRRTTELLPALREADVVDAGAKGFVRFLEGVMGLIDGRSSRPRIAPVAVEFRDAAARASFPVDENRSFRFCSEFVLRGEPLPEQPKLARAIRRLGGSLIITRAAKVAKIHIHTDDPGEVESALAALGCGVEQVKAEDMRAQHRAHRRSARWAVALVTDTTCDLPPELLLEHDITVVPLTVMFGDESFLDQVEITHEQFIARLIDPRQPQPTTSQPAPAQLERSFARAAEHGDEVLGIFLSGGVSGTLGQARATATRQERTKIRIHDSKTASLGLGFLVLRAAELAREGLESDEIVAELDRTAERSGLYITVDALGYLQRSGRLSRGRAFLGGLLDLKPLLSVDRTGSLVPLERVRGRKGVMERVLELLRARVPARRERLRMGVAHVACADVAGELAEAMRREFEPDQLLVRPAANVIAAHTGPGAWGVFYQAD